MFLGQQISLRLLSIAYLYPSCIDENLVQPLHGDGPDAQKPKPEVNATTLYISDPPYANYFYSDRHVAAHVVVTSPIPESDLSIIGPRLIVAWPAGNSGACMFFQPADGKNGSLHIELINSTVGSPLAPVNLALDGYPGKGIEAVFQLDTAAKLPLSILGSIRAIRDFTEGPSLLHPKLQEGIKVGRHGTSGVAITRLWLDNVTTTTVTFTPRASHSVTIKDSEPTFDAGEYLFTAHINYPQLEQLSLHGVLKNPSLIDKHQHETKALSFLSYSDKLLAGSWRFLTYFGRDDMISTLLLQPILSEEAVEAVIGSVLERVNRTDGSACHEEIVGDYATFLNLQEGIGSTDYRCDYSMVDTDYFVPILIHSHFIRHGAGLDRLMALLSTPAGKVDSSNKGLTWGELFILLAQKIITASAPFANPGGQTRDNMIHLKPGMDTGVWRDSVYGLGGGRIPFDVNVALAPAALRSIASLAKAFDSEVFGKHAEDWAKRADHYAQVWEDKTIDAFKVVLPQETVRERLRTFANTSTYYNGPAHDELIDSDMAYHAMALEGNNGLDVVPVMNTDASVRIFFLNGTNQERLTDFLNNTALSILRPYPAGLMTPVGLVVANPAISGNDIVNANFSNSAYHGSVVWSWQQLAMASGLERQLGRCFSADGPRPDFCSNTLVFNNVKSAYNALWDSIEQNKDSLSDEVWTWLYEDGEFKHTSLGSLPPPPGVGGIAESDVIQLWSLTFLAVKRNEGLR
jgi:hypothetical protein